MTAVAGTSGARENLAARIGLVGSGLIVFDVGFQLWLMGESFRNPLALAGSFALWLMGIASFGLALTTRLRTRLVWLIPSSLIVALWGQAYVAASSYAPLTASHTDNEMVAEFAVQALKRGQNPYAWNFSDTRRVFRDQGLLVTSLLDGSYQSRVTYPALPTLLLTALDRVGLGQARAVGLLFHTLLLVLLFSGTSGWARPIVLLPLFVLQAFSALTLGGNQDVVWSTLLVGMILAWERPTGRALLFGLACSYRQLPWFVAPFLTIYLWQLGGSPTDRWRRAAHFLGVSLSTFVGVNLPFILWDPVAWLLGVFEPAYAAFNVYSQGLGAGSQYGLVPLPRQVYTGLQVSSLSVMLVVHWRHPRWVGRAFWVFPGVFFWLYYRALANYWLYWIPPLLLALASQRLPAVPAAERPAAAPARWRRTADLAVLLVVANLLWVGLHLLRHPQLNVTLRYPLETAFDGRIARVALQLENSSERMLTPRFAVQYAGTQPLPWTIESGPETLGPGRSGVYVIHTQSAAKALPVSTSGQVVVTDAGGDYALRAVLTVPPAASFAHPDRIVNPDYLVWPAAGAAPLHWNVRPSPGSIASVRLETVAGQSALTLRATRRFERNAPAVARLTQVVTFPAELSIHVYPTAPTASLSEAAYGLELDDGDRKLWILFGESNGYGLLDEEFAYVSVPAPAHTWSSHTLRPPVLYQLFGWSLPPFSLRRANGLEFSARQLQLSLIVSAGAEGEVRGVFGPIAQQNVFARPNTLIAEAIAHPEHYYANLGAEYQRQRNYDLAQNAYLRALSYAASSAQAHNGLGWVALRRGQ